MTKHIDRLMSRASVAAMAAFAPKPDPASTMPAFAERVEDTPADGGDRPDAAIDGLTAEEQAQIDAMSAGRSPDDTGNADTAAGGDGDGEGDDPDGDGDAAPAAADGAADGAAADGGERREPRTINYKRHQKELAKAQKERDDLQAALDTARGETKKEREDRLRLDERTRMLLEAINTKQPAAAPAAPAVDADPEPDKDSDPIGHLEWKNRKLEKDVADLRGGVDRQQRETAEQAEERAVWSTLDQDISRAIAADPSFADAFSHLRETRHQELGYIFANIDITDPAQCNTLTQAEQKALSENIQRTFMNEQFMVAGQAIKSGRSPAAAIANLARARGWKPAAAAAPAEPAAAPAPRGAAPPAPRAAAPAAPAPSVKDQLEAVRSNMDASRSLSDAGGSPGGAMTPERIAAMSADEFEAYYDSIPKNQLDRMMGKPANM